MPPAKLPRATLEQKIQILDFYHRSNRPQLETVDRYKNEISISTSSFSEWLKNEDELRDRLNQAGTPFSKNSRRKVKFKYEKINHAMDLLVQQKLERHEPINEPILREYWSIYAHQFGVEDPKRLVGFSHGWLSQFKKRHGLNKKKMSGNISLVSEANNTGSNSTVGRGENDHTEERGSINEDVYDLNFTKNSTSSNNDTSDPEDNATDEFSTNATNSNGTYDLMNPQLSSNTSTNNNNPNTHFRQQGMNFNDGDSNINFSNYALYQQQVPQRQGSYQMNANTVRKDQASNNQASFDYQQQLRAHYEKQKQHYEQQQQQQHQHQQQQQQQQVQAQVHEAQSQATQVQAAQAQAQQQQRLTRSNTRNISRSNTISNAIPNPSAPQEPESGLNINASDIERFIYMFADRFFHDRQYEYPQTVKIFQEFKNSFFNERIINLKSMQQQMMQQAAVQQHVQAHQQAQKQQHQQHQHQQISGIDDFFLRAAAVASQDQLTDDSSNPQRTPDTINDSMGRLQRKRVLSSNSSSVPTETAIENKRWDNDKNGLN